MTELRSNSNISQTIQIKIAAEDADARRSESSSPAADSSAFRHTLSRAHWHPPPPAAGNEIRRTTTESRRQVLLTQQSHPAIELLALPCLLEPLYTQHHREPPRTQPKLTASEKSESPSASWPAPTPPQVPSAQAFPPTASSHCDKTHTPLPARSRAYRHQSPPPRHGPEVRFKHQE